MEPIALHDGTVLDVHDRASCIGLHCCLHNPSEHPLRTAPLQWLQGLGMMRVCQHGMAHPDPDDLAAKPLLMGLLDGLMLVEAIASVHLDRCDGCCADSSPLNGAPSRYPG